MELASEYVFPAIRGVQAGREYYVVMCPLKLIPRLFLFDEEELVPEIRAQRTLNRTRVPEIARYLVNNRDDYVFSALTASVDAEVRFDPVGTGPEAQRIGALRIAMSARFVINDGQHRRAAIQVALRDRPELAEETIAVVFFLDKGLERSQQMFADLNRYAIRPPRSLNVLYDHRDERARLAKLVIFRCPVFRGVVDTERSSLAKRSRRLFTLSAVCSATTALFSPADARSLDAKCDVAVRFWEEVARYVPEWRNVQDGKTAAAEVRQDFVHSHALGLQAIGAAGGALLREEPDHWPDRLTGLSKIDWARSNATLWEGRAMSGGRIIKGGQSLTLTLNVIKRHLDLPLTDEERRVEDAFSKGHTHD
jgi:DNA sulfur modification protein DndB